MFFGLFRGRRTPARTPQKRPNYRPRLEALEDRLLLDARFWDGGGAMNDFNASTKENWSNDTLPVAGDTIYFSGLDSNKNAIFDAAFLAEINEMFVQHSYTGTITLDRDFAVKTELLVGGGTIDGAEDLTVLGGGTFRLEGGAFKGTGDTIVKANATMTILGSDAKTLDGRKFTKGLGKLKVVNFVVGA